MQVTVYYQPSEYHLLDGVWFCQHPETEWVEYEDGYPDRYENDWVSFMNEAEQCLDCGEWINE